jgi:peroxiredoxin
LDTRATDAPAAPKRRSASRARWGRPLGVTLALATLALGPAAAETAAPLDELLRDFGVGRAAGEPPPVSLGDLAGRLVTLESQRDRVVMLYFWATWCPYCSRELPSSIVSLHREFADQGLVILAINLGEPRTLVASWAHQHGLAFPVLLDESTAVAAAYRVRATPTVVLVDRRGQLIGRAVGPREWETEGRALVQALLAVRS